MDLHYLDKTYRLKQLPQYEDIEYAPQLCCPHCCYTFGCMWIDEMSSDKIEGYVEVRGELQIVKRCKHCGKLYRFHMSKEYDKNFDFDVEAWKKDVALHIDVYGHSYLEVKEPACDAVLMDEKK